MKSGFWLWLWHRMHSSCCYQPGITGCLLHSHLLCISNSSHLCMFLLFKLKGRVTQRCQSCLLSRCIWNSSPSNMSLTCWSTSFTMLPCVLGCWISLKYVSVYHDLVPHWQTKRSPIKEKKQKKNRSTWRNGGRIIALRYSRAFDDKREYTRAAEWQKCARRGCAVTYTFEPLCSQHCFVLRYKLTAQCDPVASSNNKRGWDQTKSAQKIKDVLFFMRELSSSGSSSSDAEVSVYADGLCFIALKCLPD